MYSKISFKSEIFKNAEALLGSSFIRVKQINRTELSHECTDVHMYTATHMYVCMYIHPYIHPYISTHLDTLHIHMYILYVHTVCTYISSKQILGGL